MNLGDYRFEYVYRRVTAAQQDAIIGFWLAQRAIAHEAEARRRSQEMVLLALDPAGEIAGLSSVGLRDLPRLGAGIMSIACLSAPLTGCPIS